MERNSVRNQRIKGQFVEREVHANVNMMVEYILKKSYEDSETPFSWDDVTNYYPDNSEKIDELQEKIEELEDQEPEEMDSPKWDEWNEECREIQDKIYELEQEQEEPNEPYEWWIVSPWLCNKLKERGEVVLEDEHIWGRCTTGQAILLDSVISDICEEMEILEGQKHEWKE